MPSGLRLHRPILLGAFVVVAAILLALYMSGRVGPRPVGMTDRPCNRERMAISGRRSDDWASLCAYRELNRRLIGGPGRPRLVMIGDSNTAGWPGIGQVAINRGIGGQTSGQVLLRFQQDVVSFRPAVVHILVGSNDTAGNTGPTSPDMFMANLRGMVEMARANGIQPIIGTIPPIRDYPWSRRLKPGNWVDTLNREIHAYAVSQGIVVADYNRALGGVQGRFDPALYKDGIHPNPAGYAVMRKVLDAALAQASRERSASLN